MRPLAVALLLAVPVLADDPPENPPTLDKQIEHAKLSDAEAKALKQHGFVVGSTEYKQAFTPYLKGDAPVFVTADSLLNAFHVVFEESVYRLEKANARKLPLILADIENHLPAAEKELAGDAGLTKRASARARVFLGVAQMLLHPKAGPDDEKLREVVRAEVKRVTEAKGTDKPAWLGPPDKGFMALDYSRFKPRGFYTRGLEDYFRAVSWLQAVPWRLDNDEEYAAILLLAKARKEASKQENWVGSRLWYGFETFLGSHDDWNLPAAGYHLPKSLTADNLAASRKEAAKGATEKDAPQINDQLRFQPDTPDGSIELHYRFLSAYRLPDSVLSQRISDKRMPSGLDVAAALGSPFARGKLTKESLKMVDASAPLFTRPTRGLSPNLYFEYLSCLRVLLERTEPDAPKVFTTEAWGAKTCQTALGGWAQMRHTWALQAKDSVHYLSRLFLDAGFVEPVPEFYAAFAVLVERSLEVFEDAGAFAPPAPPGVSGDDGVAALLAIKAVWANGLAALSEEQRTALTKVFPTLPATGDPNTDARLGKMLDEAAGAAAAAIVAEEREPLYRDGYVPDPKEGLAKLATICLTLEKLAHKQLRGVAFREDEQAFLRGYGAALGKVMFYGGNSYTTPRDDAPRVVDVHMQDGKALSVGVGRPRALWVVYPWKGNDVLCRGAVLPYHEFVSPDRLTDGEWLKLLDSPKAPDQPDWVKAWTAPREKLKKE